MVLGVLILVSPGKSIIAVAVFLGIYLVVSGVAQVIFAFSLPVSAEQWGPGGGWFPEPHA